MAQATPPRAAAAPAQPAERRWPPWRLALLAPIVLAILLAGPSIYYRQQIDTRLNQARRELPQQPTQSFEYFRPINGYSNILTMGRTREAQREFISDLRDHVIRLFRYTAVPSGLQFQQTLQTARVINDMRWFLPQESLLALQQLTAIVREAVPRVRDAGTLSALETALQFFDFMRNAGAFTPANMPNYEQWRDQMFQVDRRPLRLRDTLETIQTQFNFGLEQLGINRGGAGQEFGPVPQGLSEEMLIMAENNFNQALGLIDTHKSLFPDEIPDQLLICQARLRYNKAALKVAHLIERGATLRVLGSEFMAHTIITGEETNIPNPAEMFELFLKSIDRELAYAYGIFTTPGLESGFGNGIFELMAWRTQELLQSARGGAPLPTAPDTLVNRLPSAIVQQIRDSPTPMLILNLE